MNKDYTSPNFNERAGGAAPSMIIIHYTGMQSGEEALERLCDPSSEVSAHYFISEVGEVIQLVDDDKRAWHAGKSYWAGLTDINSHSIGIELEHPGHEFGYRAFKDAQIEALTVLCKKLMKHYDIKPTNVLGHSDVAPERKQDPGELFPWSMLAAAGIGVWPRPQEIDYDAANDILLNNNGFYELLDAYGYNVANEGAVAAAFHRHFVPEAFESGDPAEITVESAAKLLALTRLHHEVSG